MAYVVCVAGGGREREHEGHSRSYPVDREERQRWCKGSSTQERDKEGFKQLTPKGKAWEINKRRADLISRATQRGGSGFNNADIHRALAEKCSCGGRGPS